jgi:hypothetical protein
MSLTLVVASLKSDTKAVRVICRQAVNDFPYEVQVLSCGTHGRYSCVDAFADVKTAIAAAARKFEALHA